MILSHLQCTNFSFLYYAKRCKDWLLPCAFHAGLDLVDYPPNVAAQVAKDSLAMASNYKFWKFQFLKSNQLTQLYKWMSATDDENLFKGTLPQQSLLLWWSLNPLRNASGYLCWLRHIGMNDAWLQPQVVLYALVGRLPFWFAEAERGEVDDRYEVIQSRWWDQTIGLEKEESRWYWRQDCTDLPLKHWDNACCIPPRLLSLNSSCQWLRTHWSCGCSFNTSHARIFICTCRYQIFIISTLHVSDETTVIQWI